MSATSPNMSLIVWNSTLDPYDSAQLAGNFAKLDQHDHANGRGVQIPTGGIADGAVTGPKLASSVTSTITTDYEFAFSSYKLVGPQRGVSIGAAIAATTPLASTYTNNFFPLYLDPADYAAGARAINFYSHFLCETGSTAPGVTLTAGLYPVTAVVNHASTLGSVVASSTVVFTTPALNTQTQGLSSAYALTAGWYVLAVALSGATAGASETRVEGRIRMRQA